MIDEDDEALKFIESCLNSVNEKMGREKLTPKELEEIKSDLKEDKDAKLDQNIIVQLKNTLSGFLLAPKGPLPLGAEVLRDQKLAIFSFCDDEPLRKDCEHWVGLLERNYPGTTVYNVGALLGKSSPKCKQLLKKADALSLDVCILYDYLKFGEKLGNTFKLYENIYKTYAAGVWPCGWVGKYPDGHILVYWPFKEDPTFENKPKN